MSAALAFEQIDGLHLANENDIFASVIDPAGEFACFGTKTTPGRVVKIARLAFPRPLRKSLKF
ncbi:MAG: hypothetical protein EA370_11195 [Wenzhouxiangella sp.]|nr:MAG: hypothetical protein EA370_11195 [Wenzhouxiangella sp.]